MSPKPKENPWKGRYRGSADCGATLTTCEHCDTRTWVLQVAIDPRVPRKECAHCGAVWEGDHVIEPPNVEVA